ncbi:MULTISPECIES: hypothetical protein [Shewanella]|nr:MULTISPECIES: hypothetical protein [Shewanella]
MFSKSIPIITMSLAALALAACSSDSSETTPEEKKGQWVKGDLHVHTAISSDARETLSDVLKWSFDTFNMDYVALSNHMRDSSQDNDDNDLGGILFFDALVHYEIPGVAELQASLYPEKTVLSTFEWDMPTHEHFNIGILGDEINSAESLEAIKTFEYLFSYQNSIEDFDPADVANWNAQGLVRQNQTHQDAINALAWLQEHFPTSSYGMLNHPRRYLTSYSISDVRELHDAAPDVFFLVEGMVGGQFSGNRGDYAGTSSGVYGGVDPVVAEVGGWWDALLGEGRRIWNVGNSDIHFKVREPYASSYFPGEYAKNYTYAEETSAQGIVDGLRTGKTFAVFGDLINELDFTMQGSSDAEHMGGVLAANSGEMITIKIRFKSPETNNKEQDIGDESFNGLNPGIHHIDLIAGNVGEKALPDTSEYYKETNDSTKVVKTFVAQDWDLDDEGFYAMSYSFVASGDQYYRLRGTNLDYNEEGLTHKGDPLKSESYPQADEGETQAWYNKINQRNYDDLWFYSNPIFVEIK